MIITAVRPAPVFSSAIKVMELWPIVRSEIHPASVTGSVFRGALEEKGISVFPPVYSIVSIAPQVILTGCFSSFRHDTAAVQRAVSHAAVNNNLFIMMVWFIVTYCQLLFSMHRLSSSSGRSFRVRSTACSSCHRRMSLGLPDRSTSGTFQPMKSAGRV